jgi:hypothetical protein
MPFQRLRMKQPAQRPHSSWVKCAAYIQSWKSSKIDRWVGFDSTLLLRGQMISPWTREVEATWRPTLRFYDHHVDFLRSLEDSKTLLAFRMEPGAAGALLETTLELEVRPGGMRIAAASPEADIELAHEALADYLKRAAPSDLTSLAVRLQYLIPSAFKDPLEAQTESAARLLGRFIPSRPGMDFAVLFDGVSEEGNSTYQVEFGVVRPEEVQSRLTGIVGRMGTGAVARFHSQDGTYAPASFFLDWRWSFGPEALEGDVYGRIISCQKQAIEESGEASSRLSVGLLVGENPKQGAM